MTGRVELRRMSEPEFAVYRAASQRGYAEQIAASGELGPAAAAVRAAEDFAELLPAGLATPGMHLWTAVLDGEPVGIGWLRVRTDATSTSAFVLDVQVHEERRGQGLGRALMLTLQREAAALGATSVGLNVFGHNTAARSLYESLGYAVTSVQMRLGL